MMKVSLIFNRLSLRYQRIKLSGDIQVISRMDSGVLAKSLC